ncbi:MAG: hypothetical protein LLG01_00780 [Planctomycetaceae bacterium]|nr:hypothetical protein [Planctomycetaceae bacterium]
MNDEIKRYRFVVEHNAKGKFSRAYAAPWEGSHEPGNDWVTFADHEADKQQAIAARDETIQQQAHWIAELKTYLHEVVEPYRYFDGTEWRWPFAGKTPQPKHESEKD